jgi:pimeloyl-ACP methyl ester carboxylesterase
MADVGAVVDRLGLVRPAIVGHSLGGMVAALWATAHEDCPLAVNVDGHGNPRGPERYAGLDPPAAVTAHAAMREFIAAGLGARPDPALARLVEALDEIDLFAAYRAARCPLLVVSGARPDFEAVLPEPASGAFAAYRACVARDLAALAAANPLVSAFSLPAGHDVHLELPRELTDLVLSRLGS